MTVGLVSIVKNEEHVIQRLIDSTKGFIDEYFFVDTGSTDSTVQIIESNGIAPYRSEWVNFGHNLTEAFGFARGKCEWLLRMDADMILSVSDGMKSWLDTGAVAHAYNVELSEGSTSWRLPLLMNGLLEWEYVGPTHEYLKTTGRLVRDVTGIKVVHVADGSNRSQKFTRDIELLAPGVEAHDERSIFYTAECYRFMGDYEKAIELYDIRASLPDTWEEEAWYAAFQAGSCALYLDEVDGVNRLLAAAARRPSRGEPLKVLADWFDSRLPLELSSDVLFVDQNAYRIL